MVLIIQDLSAAISVIGQTETRLLESKVMSSTHLHLHAPTILHSCGRHSSIAVVYAR